MNEVITTVSLWDKLRGNGPGQSKNIVCPSLPRHSFHIVTVDSKTRRKTREQLGLGHPQKKG